MKEIRFNCGVCIFEEELCCIHPGSACTAHPVDLQSSGIRLKKEYVTPRMKLRNQYNWGKNRLELEGQGVSAGKVVYYLVLT